MCPKIQCDENFLETKQSPNRIGKGRREIDTHAVPAHARYQY
jgi:hypothetical protein